MYTCKGCGGYLKFDIESQKLKCDSCGTGYDVPDESQQSMEAEYEAKIYTCPQCGGELIGDENEAVVFCSFCGSTNVLKERYEKERRPNKIIPFRLTKDQCKTIYAERLKKAKFAPKELKDPEYIDSFRGIYMPFYLYKAHVDDDFAIEAESVESHGSTDIITEYRFTGHVMGQYSDIPHDASKTFADDISESIEPFDEDDAKSFSTGYMAGFYADTADVNKDIYSDDIKNIARKDVSRKIEMSKKLSGLDVTSSAEGNINPSVDGADIGLFPVWFLSYRNKDRVAYAAINGQTGKISVDIPVDIKRFYITTLILAIPIFLILNFAMTMVPSKMLITSLVFAVISAIVTWRTQKNLTAVMSGATDKGSGRKEEKTKKVKPFMFMDLAAAVIALCIYVFSPVSDIPYYAGSLLCIIAVAVTMFSLVKVYNNITTRPMPQFKRRGGDDNA